MGSVASGATNSLVAEIGTKDLATSFSVYRFLTNGQILMFKVSKQPYQCPGYDRVIGKQCDYLPSGQKWNLKYYSTNLDKIIISGKILVFEVFKQPS